MRTLSESIDNTSALEWLEGYLSLSNNYRTSNMTSGVHEHDHNSARGTLLLLFSVHYIFQD